jgi:hypothetical protein
MKQKPYSLVLSNNQIAEARAMIDRIRRAWPRRARRIISRVAAGPSDPLKKTIKALLRKVRKREF